MGKIMILAVDLAKHVFQLHGIDEKGHTVLQRQVRRKQLPEVLAQLPACTVAMEACATAHYWARKCRELGHHPRLIAAQYIKAFNRGQKNDRDDAQAIAIAARQPDMPQVAVKTEEQQGILAFHRMRSLYSKERIALTNQLHGLLGEFGIALPRSVQALRRELTAALDRQAIPALLKQALHDQLEHLAKVEQRLEALTRQLELLARESTPADAAASWCWADHCHGLCRGGGRSCSL